MKYYVAYGSNLNREQMAHRCPEAKLVGTGMLSNYEMVFRGNKSNAVATDGIFTASPWRVAERG